MPVTSLHRKVAGIVLRTVSQHGFALAGGNALIAHGIVDRFTQDVDVFTDRQGGVEAAAEAAESALRTAGFQAERRDKTAGLSDIWCGLGEGMAEWVITAPDGEQTTLQMAYFGRGHKPVTMDVGPVLDIEDLVGWKVSALASRVEPRDYIDTAAALQRYTTEQLIGIARKLDPGLMDQDFADAGTRLDQLSDRRFAALGLSPHEIARLRERFAPWPRG
jgi:hypothetical protein